MTDTSETPAKGAKGFLLYDPYSRKHVFRIYDAANKRRFVDYQLAAEDIEIEITGNHCSLYRGEINRIDFSGRAGRARRLS